LPGKHVAGPAKWAAHHPTDPSSKYGHVDACQIRSDRGADELCRQFGTTHHTVGRSLRTHSQAHALPEKKAS